METKLNFDAFSSGQVGSKLWLCENIEKILSKEKSLSIYIFGGWYGVLGFMLLCRNNLPIENIKSFDKSKEACEIADKVNNNWIWQGWKFKSIHQDVNKVDFLPETNLVINTSTEHFMTSEWWDRIPDGMCVVIQSTNQEHSELVDLVDSVDDLKDRFPMTEEFFTGEKAFIYPDKSFKRFMLIGKK